MKKMLLFSALIIAAIGLQAHGACLIENLKLKKDAVCGGAAQIKKYQNVLNSQQSNIEDLRQMYQVPNMSLPKNYNNGFPVLNQNCMMYGACFPDLK